MLIDFHTHLDFYKEEELHQQLTDFSGTILAASVDEESYLKNLAISQWAASRTNACHIIPSFGIPPNAADQNASLLDEPTITARFEKYLDQSPVIGEIGMDFCWSKCSAANQEKVFRWFLEFCNRTGKPCVIHTKDA